MDHADSLEVARATTRRRASWRITENGQATPGQDRTRKSAEERITTIRKVRSDLAAEQVAISEWLDSLGPAVPAAELKRGQRVRVFTRGFDPRSNRDAAVTVDRVEVLPNGVVMVHQMERPARPIIVTRNAEVRVMAEAPHQHLADAMAALVEARTTSPLAGLEIVTAVEEFIELPDATNTRPPDLTDRYPGGIAEHSRAHARLIVAGLRRNIPLGNTRYCPACDTPVHPVSLACACFTPQSPHCVNTANTKENTVSDYDTPYDLAADQYANGDYEHDPDATVTVICPVCEHMGLEFGDPDPDMRAFEFTGTPDQARKLLVDHLADIEGEDGGAHDNVTVAEYIAKGAY